MPACERQLGSFPNTRQRPRKPTIDADTNQIAAKNPLGAPDFISENVPDNTYTGLQGDLSSNGNTVLQSRNLDRTYITLRNIDTTNNIVYGYRDRANLAITGMVLRAGDSVDIESPGAIFVRSLAAGLDVLTAYDEGIG